MNKGILEIDIPKNCDECPIRQAALAYCLIAKKSTSHHPSGKVLEQSKRPNWCPIKPKTDDWIPVSEYLPEETMNPVTNDFYIYPVTFKNGDITDVRYYKFGNGHWWHGPQVMDDKVTAWMPLPEPYKEGK